MQIKYRHRIKKNTKLNFLKGIKYMKIDKQTADNKHRQQTY